MNQWSPFSQVDKGLVGTAERRYPSEVPSMSPKEPLRVTSDEAVAAWTRDEYVVAVDACDNVLGPMARSIAHAAEGRLHRAFMTILVDKTGHLLLCRRSEHKRLWPRYWADSCAGHPHPGEGVEDAAVRRCQEELGCIPRLKPLGSFVYQASYQGIGSEHELCHVLVGRLCRIRPNPSEIAEAGLFHWERLERRIADHPEDFAPWVVECLRAFPPGTLVDRV